MHVAPRSGVIAATLLLLSACGSGDGSGTVPSEDGETTGVAWRVDSTPMFNLTDDGAASEPIIGIAEGVTRLPDGDVLIADRGLFALRWFAPDGSLRKSLGREGLGPDEFKYIAGMYRCGDAMFVWDLGRGAEYQGYALDGTRRAGVQVPSPDGEQNYRTVCNTAGTWLSMGWEQPDAMTQGRFRATVPFWVSTPDGAVRAELGSFPGSERQGMPGSTRPHPLGKEPVLAIGRDRAYVGSADSFFVQAFTLDGEPAGVLRDANADLSTTPDDIARYKYRDTLGQKDEAQERLQRAWESVEFPPTVPAYDAMLVDAEDLVWVRRYPRGIGEMAEWLVFRSDGTRVTTVRLPEALTVHEIGTDYIAGIAVDPLDGRQSVRLYALTRSSGAALR